CDLFQAAAGQLSRIAGIKQLNAEKPPVNPDRPGEIIVNHRIVDGDDWRLLAQWLNLHDIPSFERRFGSRHAGRELPHGRRLKKGHDIDFNVKDARNLVHKPHGQEGMSSELEKIRRRADVRNLKDLSPN